VGKDYCIDKPEARSLEVIACVGIPCGTEARSSLSSAGYSPNRLTDTSFALLQWLAYLTAEKRLSNEFADTIG